RVAAAALEREDPGISLHPGVVRRPDDLLVTTPEHRELLPEVDELLDPLERGAVRRIPRLPHILTVRRIVAAGELLLRAVIDAGDALLRELEGERVVEPRDAGRVVAAEVEEAADVVVVEEVHQRLLRGDADAARGGVLPEVHRPRVPDPLDLLRGAVR